MSAHEDLGRGASPPVIELDQVTLFPFGGSDQTKTKTILDAVTLTITEGETIAIVGPSGSGKTSLLRIILGLLAPSRGTVRLRGRDVSRDGRVLVPPEARGLGVVFQDLALWPHLSVHGNLAFGLDAKKAKKGHDASKRDHQIQEALARVDLAGFEPRAPGSLSGGEKQRVAIARALVTDPDVLLLDEPLASLDITLKADILALLSTIFRERKRAATIFITHDPREVARLDAARIVVLELGVVTQNGTLAELRANPKTPFVRAFTESAY